MINSVGVQKIYIHYNKLLLDCNAPDILKNALHTGAFWYLSKRMTHYNYILLGEYMIPCSSACAIKYPDTCSLLINH